MKPTRSSTLTILTISTSKYSNSLTIETSTTMKSTNATNNMSFSSPESLWLREVKVKDLILDKKRLVEVPYTASLADTMNALVANHVVAMPVAAPPGHWIGAEEQSGSGVVDLEKRMSVPVSTIIGHSLEGLSLWTMNPNTSVLDSMEVFSKGIHRALVPLDSQMENVSGVELSESSSGYRMLTQLDVLRYLKAHESELKNVMSRTVGELGAMVEEVFAVSNLTTVIEAIKCMRTASLNAVPIIQDLDILYEEHSQLVDGRGRKLIGTFSATDLRGCPIDVLQALLQSSVLEFTENMSTKAGCEVSHSSRELVTCNSWTPLAEVVEKATNDHVHRVWVVDQLGLLEGIVSITDMLRVIRTSMS
ncbi:hypothetical protein GIB67_037435 [Kingdonia uniflora]|uniref:CBS domain-containing protein n=1 Tax=Kingdonia uniflora TaxID=39325 RepID=A0A7J7NU02_9MAGN|nr:hypothetical protein GIB67_037435 [Kingdonia uniflora]